MPVDSERAVGPAGTRGAVSAATLEGPTPPNEPIPHLSLEASLLNDSEQARNHQ